MRPVRVSTVALAAMLLVAACGQPNGAGSAAKALPFDQQFVDMMVPHHQGAVEMAKIAQQRGEHAEIKKMAGEVIAAQDAEIAQMKAWRKEWFGSDQTPPMSAMPMVEGMTMSSSGGHGGGHAGAPAKGGGTMDMAADVETLRKAGEPFDRAFIDAMIPHHASAIDAAKAAATRAQKPEIKKLAADVVAAQEREITEMTAWRRSWYGA